MNQHIRDYYRGEVYFAKLDPAFGHEQGGTRPVLILQNDIGNYYSPTVIVAASTSKEKKPDMPTHVTFESVDGLVGKTMFMLEVLRTIDKRRIRCFAGKLTPDQMAEIDSALRVSLRLSEDEYLPTEAEAP